MQTSDNNTSFTAVAKKRNKFFVLFLRTNMSNTSPHKKKKVKYLNSSRQSSKLLQLIKVLNYYYFNKNTFHFTFFSPVFMMQTSHNNTRFTAMAAKRKWCFVLFLRTNMSNTLTVADKVLNYSNSLKF